MKYTLSILLIAICLPVHSQVTLKPEKVKEDLMQSVNSLHFVYHSYELENELRPHHLDLLPDKVLTSPPVYNKSTQQQLTFEVFTTNKQRQEILDYIISNGLHDNLYLKMDAGYIWLDKPEVSIPLSKVLCDFELFFGSKEHGLLQLFLPIQNNQDAIGILQDIRKYFRKRDRIEFNLIIKELVENDA